MSRPIDLLVPDIGNFDAVPIVDVLVKVGDSVEVETPLITLETDKATMDVPSAAAGTITELLVKRGDKVGKGTVIARIDAPRPRLPQRAAPAAQRAPTTARAQRHPRRAREGGTDAAGDTVRMPVPDVSALSTRRGPRRTAARRSSCWARVPVAIPLPFVPRTWA